MPFLSKGQRQILVSKKNLDGSPASPQYVNLIRRNLNLKVYETSQALRELYENFPGFKTQIENDFSWLLDKHKAKEHKNNHAVTEKSTARSPFPDSLDDAVPVHPSEIDQKKAFRGMPGFDS